MSGGPGQEQPMDIFIQVLNEYDQAYAKKERELGLCAENINQGIPEQFSKINEAWNNLPEEFKRDAIFATELPQIEMYDIIREQKHIHISLPQVRACRNCNWRTGIIDTFHKSWPNTSFSVKR